jgi:hypothetical protein
LEPFTVSVNAAPPAVVNRGERFEIAGIGAFTGRACGAEIPGLTTVMEAVLEPAMSGAGTCAVSCVAETNVVVRADPFQFTTELLMRPVPFTVNVNAPPPAVAEAGERLEIESVAEFTAKDCAADVPPPGGGFTTVTGKLPELATSLAGTAAVSFVPETKVVVNAVPFQSTAELLTKLEPFTVIVNAAPPAVAEDGERLEIVGTGEPAGFTGKDCAADAPPPGAGFTTRTEAVPGLAILLAGTCAMSCAEETKVVASVVPFHCTAELAIKLEPFTLKVNAALPAVAEEGERLEASGTGALMVNDCCADVPPLGPEFTTVTDAVAEPATSAAGTCALSCAAETYVVASADPFQFTSELLIRPAPFTVNVNAALPAVALDGWSDVIAGLGF